MLICTIKLQLPFGNACILAIFRTLSGKFSYFLNVLDDILKSVYNTYLKFINCGDININYCVNSNKKTIGTSLSSFNLSSTV